MSPGKQQSQPLPTRSACRAFWEGLTQPSLTALLATLIFAASLLILIFTLVNGDFLAHYAKYMADGPTDDYCYVTTRLVRLSNEAPKKPRVVILGGSSTRESIISIDDLRGIIGDRVDTDFDLIDLTTSAQSYWEMVAMLDMLGKQGEGIVVLPVNMIRHARGADYLSELIKAPRLGFISPKLDEEARHLGVEVPNRTSSWFWNNRHFVLARMRSVPRNIVRLQLGRSLKAKRHRYLGMEPKNMEEWAENMAHVDELMSGYEAAKEDNFALLARTIDRLREQGGMRVVLVECPVNPRFLRDAVGKKWYPSYLQDMTQFAADKGVEYWNFNAEAALTESDYYDYCHLRTEESMVRYSQVFGSALAELMNKYLTREVTE